MIRSDCTSGGGFELTNIRLQRQCFLERLGVPLELVVGIVGRVTLDTPLLRLALGSPAIVKAQDCFFVFRATTTETSEFAAVNEQIKTRVRLQAQFVAACGDANFWLNFGLKYAAKIEVRVASHRAEHFGCILKVIISNLHVRFERAAHRSAVGGVRIRQLTSLSDKNEADRESAFARRLELSDVRVYWETSGEPIEKLEIEQLKQRLSPPPDARDCVLAVDTLELRASGDVRKFSVCKRRERGNKTMRRQLPVCRRRDDDAHRM